MSRKVYGAVACLWALCPGAAFAAGVEPPTPAALALVRNLRATGMGVDREGNLWAWDGHTGRVVLCSPAGTTIESASADRALAVDADRILGVAAVADSGFELRLRPWKGAEETVIPLVERASAVAWAGPDAVALGMATAEHRVEIWNVREKRLAKTLGVEAPLPRKPGLSRLRVDQLRYNPATDQLWTLESFSGDLQVFAMDGHLVRRDQVPPGTDRGAIEAWLADLDAKGRASGVVKEPLITWYRLGLDAAGRAWTVQSCEPKGHATLVQLSGSGAPRVLSVEEPCCSRAFVIWGAWAIFYRDPSDPPLQCNGERRLP